MLEKVKLAMKCLLCSVYSLVPGLEYEALSFKYDTLYIFQTFSNPIAGKFKSKQENLV